MAWASHDKITELFLGVARQQHAENRMDDELQIGLGVLFYTAGEYNRAQDCFAAALSVRPKASWVLCEERVSLMSRISGLSALEQAGIVVIQ